MGIPFASYVTRIVCVLVSTTYLVGAIAMGATSEPVHTINQWKLYPYTSGIIESFLRDRGYLGEKKFTGDITRNSDGSALRFFFWDEKKAIVASCDGSVKEVELKGDRVWLNDESKIVAWRQGTITHFSNGAQREGGHQADPSGRYFSEIPLWSRNIPMRDTIEIYATERPTVPLAKIQILDSLTRLFVKDDKVIVIGPEIGNRNILAVHIFQERGASLSELEKLRILRPKERPSPFYVEDLSPWSDEVLLVDVQDFPFQSKWYIFNLATQEIKLLGNRSSYGFYLKCDVINSARETQ